MSKGKYYSTLKLMEQIEHTHLSHVEQFKFAKTIQGNDSITLLATWLGSYVEFLLRELI